MVVVPVQANVFPLARVLKRLAEGRQTVKLMEPVLR